MKRITLREIAENANVSIGTVDRALHNRGRINPETASRIRKICDDLGYEPNIVGKSMALQKKGKVIAVIINASEKNAFSAEIHRGIEQYASEIEDYNIHFDYYDQKEGSVSELSQILDEIYDLNIDGLIVKPIDNDVIRNKLKRISEEKHIPIIACSSDIAGVDLLAYAGQNHNKLGRLAACTLLKIEKMPLNILVVVGSFSFGSARQAKLDGFIEYINESGRNCRICSVVEVPLDNNEAERIVLKALNDNPDVNAFYMHSHQIETCLDALDAYGNFRGVKFTFGMPMHLSKYIKAGRVDYAISEYPYEQGYYSGDIMFNYLLKGKIPDNNVIYMDGNIIFEENC